MLEIKPDTEFALSESIILKRMPELDQYYAFDIATGDHFSLNATAYWVFERIEQNNLRDILQSFARTFDLKEQDALRDLTELLESALENRIIMRRK